MKVTRIRRRGRKQLLGDLKEKQDTVN